MPKKAKLQAATVGGTADDIEAAFYEALQNADITQLMACWADEDEIVCVHPGGPRLVGGRAIRAAFEAMFANGSIQARPERLRKVESLASAVHNVLERVDILTPEGPRRAWVVATNVYHKTAQGWRLVAHHASPGTASEVEEVSAAPQVLH
jgi:ketosteroid isomerase-like protein